MDLFPVLRGSPLVSIDKYRQCRLQCGHRCQKEMQSLVSLALARSPKLIIYSYTSWVFKLLGVLEGWGEWEVEMGRDR